MAAPTELRDFLDGWRLSQGWSLQKLADEVGVHQSLVSKWLHPDARRRVVPQPARLRRIAQLTGVPYSQLRRYVDPDDVDEGDTGRWLDPDLMAIVSVWPKLSEGRKEAIKVLAAMISDSYRVDVFGFLNQRPVIDGALA